MRSTQFVQFVMVAVSATATSALHLDAGLFGGVHHEGAVKRQDDNESDNPLESLLADPVTSATGDSSPTATSEDEETTTTERTTATPTVAPPTTTRDRTTDETTPTQDPPTATPTQDDPTTTRRTTTDDGTTILPGIPSITSTEADDPTPTGGQTRPTTATSVPPAEETVHTTLSEFTSAITDVIVITQTDSNGQQTTFESQTTRTTTGSTLVTNESDPSNPNMSGDTKKTVIGVTVGVGGAIVIGAAALLYWRLRNKKRTGEESEDLVSYGTGFPGPGTAEKSEPVSSPGGRSPFQSTLESYHAPSSTNAASNF